MPLPFLLTLFILAALLYKLTRYKRSGQILFCSSFITLLLLSLDPVATRLAATLESQYPSYQHQTVDYIHVLGNGHTTVDSLPITSQLTPTALARTTEGVRIYKLNPTAKLIFSGYSDGEINSNAMMYGIRINSNTANYHINNNSNVIAAQDIQIRLNSNAIKYCCRTMSNAIGLLANRVTNNSTAINYLDDRVTNNSNAIVSSTSELAIQNSNLLLVVNENVINNSNAINYIAENGSELARQNSDAIILDFELKKQISKIIKSLRSQRNHSNRENYRF